MAIWPKCPTCFADAHDGDKFRIVPEPLNAIEESEPRWGEHMTSLAQLDCVRCGFRFTLWTYKIGDSTSFHANATDDDGVMWDPDKNEPWWS
jgi:hypothetical protein